MSRILRRPMFRGGPASSEGVGITSGLNNPRQGYADGPDDQGVQSYDEFGGSSIMESSLPGYSQGVENPYDVKLRKMLQESKDSFLPKPTLTTEPKENVSIQNKTPTSLYDEYSDIIKKANLVDQDEIKKQKYLELAKFGLNLLRQPGGLPGGKSDLLGAIAASAEKPLEGYQAIISKEQQAKRLPKALALEAAMKLSDPSDISKKIKSLAQISGLSEQQVAKSFITTGESSLKSITSTAESLAEDVGKLPALKIATTMQEAGISISQVKKLPKDTKGNIVGDKVNEGFYYDNDGTLYKFGKDKKLQPVITK
jgi:hypothetical protein